MAYYIDLFSPETYQAFTDSDRSTSGFRTRHEGLAKRIVPGDTLVCYVTKLSRWVGLLTVDQGPYKDDTPIFVSESDPFVVRFKVTPTVWLDLDKAVPIHDEEMWNGLSFTRVLPPNSIAWTGKVRGSLVRLDEEDGEFIGKVLGSNLALRRLIRLTSRKERE
jgi:predicted RNA-binding protein